MSVATPTPEQRAQFPAWEAKWRANGLNTVPMSAGDKAAMVAALDGIYTHIEKQPPPKEVIFVASVRELLIEAPIKLGLTYLQDTPDAVRAICPGIDLAEGAALAREVLWAKALGETEPKVPAKFKNTIALYTEIHRLSRNLWDGGNLWSGWPCHLSFYRCVVGVTDEDTTGWPFYEEAAVHGGPRIMAPGFAMVCDRPEFIAVDAGDRLHAVGRSAIRWRDGFELFRLHGVPVPERIITKPETITLEEINNEKNAEVRRAMLSLYGMDRFLQDSNAQPIGTDDWGSLYQIEHPGGQRSLLVKVVNSTPEPDGTFKDYCLRVHPELRPLVRQGNRVTVVGQPQEMTARNAVASTFGKRGAEYAPEMES
jgi:hypothetical protein